MNRDGFDDRPSFLDHLLKVLGVTALALLIVIQVTLLYYGVRTRNAALRAGDALSGIGEQSGEVLEEQQRAYCEDVEPVGVWTGGTCVMPDE